MHVLTYIQEYGRDLPTEGARVRVVTLALGVTAQWMVTLHNVCCVDCLEEILVSWFKDRLNDNLYNACVTQGALACLHDWYILAEEAEINQARN